MQQLSTIRNGSRLERITRTLKSVVALSALSLLGSIASQAQVAAYGDKSMGDPSDHLPNILNHATITQKLNQPLPLDAHFVDETGKPVLLGEYFNNSGGKRPVILALVYYNCPILCSEELKGLTGALEMVSFEPGKDFDVVVVSIDPSEKPELAASQKRKYLKFYGHPETAAGWHFLTGEKPAIDALSDATGFGYVRVPGPDGKLDQFAHASSIEIVTPDGRLAQYYLGVEYSPKDIRLGLVEAADHKIGTPVDNILTYCYHYDPQQNKHSLYVARVVQLGGVITVLILGGFMFLMFRNDFKQARVVPKPQWDSKI
jgi:protein SCO1